MAINIKSIPVLKEKAARDFSRKIASTTLQKSSVNFSKEIAVSDKILQKAKI